MVKQRTISKDNDDFILDNDTAAIEYVIKYLMGRYCENSKTQLETIKRYTKDTAKTQLEK